MRSATSKPDLRLFTGHFVLSSRSIGLIVIRGLQSVDIEMEILDRNVIERREQTQVDCVELTSIVAVAQTDLERQRNADAFTHYLAGLPQDGQELELRYAATQDRLERASLTVRLRSATHPSLSPLTPLLAGVGGLSFERRSAVAGPQPYAERRHTLFSPAILIRAHPRRTIGFGRGVLAPSAITAVVTPSTWLDPSPIDLLLPTVVHAPLPLAFDVTLSPVHLSPFEQKILEGVEAALADGDAEEWTGRRWQLVGARGADALHRTIGAWLATPRGYRFGFGLSSAEDAAAIVPLVRQALFGDSGAAEHRGASCLSLGGCIPASSILPRLVPIVPTVTALLKRTLPPPPAVMSTDGIVIGTAKNASGEQSVTMSHGDRFKHVFVCGASGTGKSTLLARMIAADIEANRTVVVIDPHGDLIADVLTTIPACRADDVIALRPGDRERAFGLNLLEAEDRSEQQKTYLCSELMAILGVLYDLDHVGGPMFEQYIRAACQLAMSMENRSGTLVDVVRIFEDDAFRQRLLSECGNRVVVDFWEKQAARASGEAALRSMAPYVTSKLNQFVANGSVRPIIGQSRSTVDFASALDRQRIILLDLSAGLSLLDTRLLGMLALARLFAVAIGRAARPRPERHPVFVYVDECQLFCTTSLGDLMAMGRKFAIGMTLATQNISQLTSAKHACRLLDTILGNVGSLLLFRLGPSDSARFEAAMSPELTPRDLESLPDHHVACRLISVGQPLPPFVFRSLMPAPQNANVRAAVNAQIQVNYASYTRAVQDVEIEIGQARDWLAVGA